MRSAGVWLGVGIVGLAIVWVSWFGDIVWSILVDYNYSVDIISTDNFYNSVQKQFGGNQETIASFVYRELEQLGSIVLVENIFDVRTVTGEPVFSVEREYGIDRKSGRHVAGYGDRDREGWLFAPRSLSMGDDYNYWHINYDVPVRMEFLEVDEIEGLRVFHYKSRDLIADQTADLTGLPGVGQTRGVRTEVNLETWIEPITGHLVKYEDSAVASFYDLDSGRIIEPWNKFSNKYQRRSVSDQVQKANNNRLLYLSLKWLLPVMLIGTGAGLIIPWGKIKSL